MFPISLIRLRSLAFLAVLTLAGGTTAAETPPAAAPPAVTRIALVADGGPTAENLLDLTQASLPQTAGVQYVDRQSIRKILAEQKLSAAYADPNRAVSLGQLLAADIFAVLELSPDPKNPQPLGLVAFDAATGLRLADASLPADADSVPAAVEAALRAAAEKRARSAGKTLCIVSVRNANLPRSYDSLCDSLSLLLQRRLIASPDTRILERQRLDRITAERALPAASAPAPLALLASLVTIDLEISRSPDGQSLTAAAFLADPQGKSLGKVSVTAAGTDLDSLSAQLAVALAKQLRFAPPGDPPNLQLEARRFHNEALTRLAHQDFTPALRAAEAAAALDPKDPAHTPVLVRALLWQARNMLHPGKPNVTYVTSSTRDIPANADIPAAYAIATRAVTLRTADLAATPEINSRTLARAEVQYERSRWIMVEFVNAVDINQKDDADLADACRTYRHAYRDFALRELAARRALMKLGKSEFFTVRYTVDFAALKNACDTPAEFVDAFVPWAGDYLTFAAPLIHEVGFLYLDEAQFLMSFCSDGNLPPHWHVKSFPPAERAKLNTLLDQLALDKDPAIALTLLRMRRALAADAAKDPPPAHFQQVKKLAIEAITHTPVPDKVAPRYRAAVYGLWADVLDTTVFSDPPQRGTEFRALARTMIDRREFTGFVFRKTLDVLAAMPGEKTALPQLLADAQAAINAPDARFIDSSRAEYAVLLQTTARDIGTPTTLAATPAPRRLLATHPPDGILEYPAALSDDRELFAVGCEFIDHAWTLQAVSVPLAGGTVKTLGRFALPSLKSESITSGRAARTVLDACLSPTHLYLATAADGILAFPRNGDAPSAITEKQGLPSNKTRAVAFLDDKLYIGYGILAGEGEGNYLVAHDLKTAQTQVLASSRRKEHLSPFDDSPGFQVWFIAADAPRHRILFHTRRASTGGGFDKDLLTGLWQFTPEKPDFKRLVPFTISSNFYWHDLQPDGTLLFGSFAHLYSFNPATDKLSLLYDIYGKGPTEGGLRADDAPFKGNLQLQPAWALVRGELWSASPLARVPADGTPQLLPPLAENPRPSPSTLRLLPDANTLLITTNQGAWLLPLPPAKKP